MNAAMERIEAELRFLGEMARLGCRYNDYTLLSYLQGELYHFRKRMMLHCLPANKERQEDG